MFFRHQTKTQTQCAPADGIAFRWTALLASERDPPFFARNYIANRESHRIVLEREAVVLPAVERDRGWADSYRLVV
jgi:hypothetical protein